MRLKPIDNPPVRASATNELVVTGLYIVLFLATAFSCLPDVKRTTSACRSASQLNMSDEHENEIALRSLNEIIRICEQLQAEHAERQRRLATSKFFTTI